ncbi:uncharacterized protein ColSpa_12560 [Colletotrichum spaethianum]|uniref:C2H2-type domain-containing protein n=1 Tax=Colletotrichum spaethianum TaxID=700344 RepID=A0AA37UL87_9PEZI|nr:uncharacterized protein ColSpa_12560 [Colletotrichum spaethianum]GKT52379.1 hypothetical protein ColSpa_12560 [Colletotrichum spaethianum]
MSPKRSSGNKYVCKEPGCNSKPFARKDGLKRHIREVHGTAPAVYVPMPCKKQIKSRKNDKSNIERHLLTCIICKATELDIASMLNEAFSASVASGASDFVGGSLPEEATPGGF